MIEMILDGTYQHSSVDKTIINETRIKQPASFDTFTISICIFLQQNILGIIKDLRWQLKNDTL